MWIGAPLAGSVVKENPALQDLPEQLVTAPYTEGWIAEFQAEDMADMKQLVPAELARERSRLDLQRSGAVWPCTCWRTTQGGWPNSGGRGELLTTFARCWGGRSIWTSSENSFTNHLPRDAIRTPAVEMEEVTNETDRTLAERGVRDTGLVLAVMVGVLLFAVVAIAMRPLLILVALVALASVWCCTASVPASASGLTRRRRADQLQRAAFGHGRSRASEPQLGAGPRQRSGGGRRRPGPVHPGSGADGGTAADGSRVEQGDRLFRLRRGARCVEVRLPCRDGRRRERGSARASRLVNDDPFERGWA